jgi:hypothetical protein
MDWPPEGAIENVGTTLRLDDRQVSTQFSDEFPSSS